MAAQNNTFSADRVAAFSDVVLTQQKTQLEASGANKGSAVSPRLGFVPFSFVNASNNSLISYSNMYIVVKGLDPINGNPCFVSFTPAGVGSCVDTSASTVSSNYTYQLSTLPTSGGVPYVYMPPITSARIYVSVNYKLVLTVNGGPDYTISDPSPTITTDPSYYYLYDKVEFNLQLNQCVINPTLVDFFCLPLPITVSSSSGCNLLYAGMPPTQNREAIFTGFQTAVSAVENAASQTQWGNLLLTQTSPAKNLRILSTNTAINAAPPIFDTEYLLSSTYGADWLTDVWHNGSDAYWESNTLWMDVSQVPTYGIYSGQVNTTTGTFLFTPVTGAGSAVSVTLPTSSVPFFAGTGFVTTGDANAAPIIEKFISAGFVSGILPTTTSEEDPVNNSFFQALKPYYQANANLPEGTGPWYDLYSQVLHSYAVYPYNFYTYAYDDVLGNDNTITSNNILLNPITITITLGDMSGTTP